MLFQLPLSQTQNLIIMCIQDFIKLVPIPLVSLYQIRLLTLALLFKTLEYEVISLYIMTIHEGISECINITEARCLTVSGSISKNIYTLNIIVFHSLSFLILLINYWKDEKLGNKGKDNSLNPLIVKNHFPC